MLRTCAPTVFPKAVLARASGESRRIHSSRRALRAAGEDMVLQTRAARSSRSFPYENAQHLLLISSTKCFVSKLLKYVLNSHFATQCI